MKTKVFLIALFIMNAFLISAQTTDEVTLVVSADGATKEEAIKVALRSAIEQAYGTFVSSNTTILNDELVKDEIVTISNGNIKEYREIASLILPNGNQSVTLKATVCVSKLVSYAKNKGASTEFAGAAFMMNVKMKELNKKNEKEALNNLLAQVKALIPDAFDRKLDIKTPKVNEEGNYVMEMNLNFTPNDRFQNIKSLIKSTLESISLSEHEREEYRAIGLKMTSYEFYYWEAKKADRFIFYYFRNDSDFFKDWSQRLLSIYSNEKSDYKIVDNNGQIWQTGSNKSLWAIGHESYSYEVFFGYSDWGFENGGTQWYYSAGSDEYLYGKFQFKWHYDEEERLSFTISSQYLPKISNLDVIRL